MSAAHLPESRWSFQGVRPIRDSSALLVEEERESGPLSLQELLILDHLWLERRMTMPETMAVIQLGQGTARRHLVGLIERGLVEARGSGRERSYLLSLATHRRLGAESEYVRRRGFNPASQERMVMEYVRTHGRITRRETKALCEIKSAQATRLLRRVGGQGRVEDARPEARHFVHVREARIRRPSRKI